MMDDLRGRGATALPPRAATSAAPPVTLHRLVLVFHGGDCGLAFATLAFATLAFVSLPLFPLCDRENFVRLYKISHK